MAKLAFLTRGDGQWGMGHLHRVSWLLAALDEIEPLGLYSIVHCVDSPAARTFWSDRGRPVKYLDAAHLEDAFSLPDRLELHPGDTLIIDWLESPVEAAARLQAAGIRLVLLDDYGPAQHHANSVINSLLSPLDRTLLKLSDALVFSGVDYVQLPLETTRLRGVATATTRAMATELHSEALPPAQAHCILVSFGGNPRPELISLALEAISQVQFTGRVIVIPTPLKIPTVPDGLDVEFIAGGPEFHGLLAAADLAILGGGLSLYEAVFLGVPAVAIAVLNSTPGRERHQLLTIAKLSSAGGCRSVGAADEISSRQVADALDDLLSNPLQRGRMSAAGQSLIDGQGLARTIELILTAAGAD